MWSARWTNRVLDAVEAIAVTFWVGALWTSGLIVAPLLFRLLDDRTLAGTIAGSLFELTTFIGLACGACVLVIWFSRQRGRAAQQRRSIQFYILSLVVAMLALALAQQYGLQPVLAAMREQAYPQPVMQSALGERFAAWHMVSALLYLAQCALGAGLVVLRFVAAGETASD